MSSLLLPLLLLGTAVVAVGVKYQRDQLPAQVVNAPRRPPTPEADPVRSAASSASSMRPPEHTRRYRTPWEALVQEDFPGFVRMLREGGCPEETIQDFGVAALGRRFQEQVEAPMRQRVRESTWWREANRDGPFLDLAGATRRGREELDRELHRLLGVPGSELRRGMGWDPDLPETRWLPPEKREVLTRLERHHAAELDALEARALPGATGPILTDDLRAQLRELRIRQREELGVALGEEDYRQYLVRESAEARYVLWNLPQAKDAEEFRLWVQAAIDVGVEQADVLADERARYVPARAMGNESPRLRERVVARFRELSDPERGAALEADLAAEQRREAEERDRQREISKLEHLQATATEAGVTLGLEEARRFTEALDRHSQELERRWGRMPESPSDADRAVWEGRLREEFEKVAVEVLGERGRVLTETLARQQKAPR